MLLCKHPGIYFAGIHFFESPKLKHTANIANTLPANVSASKRTSHKAFPVKLSKTRLTKMTAIGK